MKATVVVKNSPNKGMDLNFGMKARWDPTKLLFNSKSETVNELASFKKLFRESRCLVPADFFGEWKKNEDGTKTPYIFKPVHGGPFAFAAIHDEEGFSILTSKPNSLMRPIHHRQPVVLRREDEEKWLDLDADPDQLLELLEPYENRNMTCYPVSPKMNSASYQDEDLLEPIEVKMDNT